ncbi:hypothetical protein BGZ46_007929 [Entomortierella lignicola]|nr:hypothetical protein BGZ46_007929 [Entomortierella lignicola]
MSSLGEKDNEPKAGASKELLDLYDGTDDLLDYGDTYDLDTELLDADLADENYDEFDLGPEDDLLLNSTGTQAQSNGDENQNAIESKVDQNGVTTKSDDTTYVDNIVENLSTSQTSINVNSAQDDKKNDLSTQNQNNQGQRDGNVGGYNRQMNNGRPPFSSLRGGRGGPGGIRGRGQNYMGMGRNNFQGNAGMGHHSMMGMNMGMNMGLGVNGMGVNPVMAQGMNLGVNMNMGMGMMGMGGGRFPGDGYGNQGVGYPFGRGSGMDNRMNPGMGGMNVRGPGVGIPGRTIHINPKFQNRVGVSPIPGQGVIPSDRSPTPQYPQQQQQQQQQQRPYSQDSGRGQARTWENKSNSSSSQTTRDDRNDDRNELRHSGRDDKGINYDRSNALRSSRSPDRGARDSRDSNRPSTRSDRDERSSRSSQSDSRKDSTSQQSSLETRSRSPHGVGGGITSRLGLKRSGEGLDDSYKAHKSSGISTPRGEQARATNTAERDTGSVSFLRDKKGPAESSRDVDMGSNRGVDTEPKGFVKMDNIPESLSDASIRKLADGISGVNRVLTISKKGGGIVTLGFASIDEAKFFRRQINRTTIEGSLVTVTLASS